MARHRQLTGPVPSPILPLPPYLMGLSANPLARMTKRQKLLLGGGILLIVAVALNRQKVATGIVKGAEAVKSAVKGAVTDLLTLETVAKAVPRAKLTTLAKVLPYMTEALEEAQINTPARLAAFLAQCSVESVYFTAMEERASGEAYEGREDLGNVQKGDGPRYKGRGPIQLTGRSNYRAFTQDVGVKYGLDFEANPDLVADYKWGFKAAAWFWNKRGLNKWSDSGDFAMVTYRINGGCNGQDQRVAIYRTAKERLGIAGMPENLDFNANYGNNSRFGVSKGTHRSFCGKIKKIKSGKLVTVDSPIPYNRTKSGDDELNA